MYSAGKRVGLQMEETGCWKLKRRAAIQSIERTGRGKVEMAVLSNVRVGGGKRGLGGNRAGK